MNAFEPMKTSPVFEMLCYFTRRINGNSVAERVAELVRAMPSKASAINSAAERALLIERELDKRIDVSDEAYASMFRRFDNNASKDYLSHTAAYMLIGSTLLENPALSVRELKESVLSFDDRMRMFHITLNQANQYVYLNSPDDHAAFLRHVDLANLPPEGKWACIDCYLHFEERLDALTELLEKGVEIYNEVIKGIEVAPDYGVSTEDRDAFIAALSEVSLVSFDPTADLVLYGSDMLFSSFIFSLITHEGDDERPDEWQQTSAITGFTKFRIHSIEQESCGSVDMAEGLRAISDPSRLEILKILSEKSVYGKELCAMLDLTPGTVSKHITKLINAGLVDCRMDSIRAYYSLNKGNAYALLRSLDRTILGDWEP